MNAHNTGRDADNNIDPGAERNMDRGAARDEHYVSDAPFDPHSVERLTADQEKYFFASRRQLMWWKFKRHKVAVTCGFILLALYTSTLISEFIAPYNLHSRDTHHIYAPPQGLHLFHRGQWVGPFVYGYDYRLNLDNLKREYIANPDKVQRLRFFCSGDAYRFWGRIDMDFHFVCPAEDGTLFLLGTDRLGRDMFSRVVYGARISLLIGLVGIAASLFLGLLLGGLAGYYGGWVDSGIQRLIEILRSFPELPLWMALPEAHHRPPPAARFRQPHHRLGHAVDSRHDPRRDRAVVPRPRPASAHHQLGRAVERSAKHECRGVVSVADSAGSAGHHYHPRVQLLRRRPARRGRPV